MNHLKKFFSYDYQFQVHTFLSRSDKVFAVLGVVAIVLAVLFKIAAASAANPIDKKFRNKLYSLLLFVGIWEVVWFGCRYEDAMFFGSHFVALLGFLIGAIWLVKVVMQIVKQYRPEKQAWEKEQIKLKYLPR